MDFENKFREELTIVLKQYNKNMGIDLLIKNTLNVLVAIQAIKDGNSSEED